MSYKDKLNNITEAREKARAALVDQLTDAQYHARPELSASKIIQYEKNPGGSFKPSPAISLGSCIHATILINKPPTDLKELLKPEQFEVLKIITQKAKAHEYLNKELNDKNSIIEKPVFWKENNIAFRGKPDIVNKDGYVIDLKTTGRLDKPIRVIVRERRYDIQAAMYLNGVSIAQNRECKGFIIYFLETVPPYEIAVCQFSEDTIRRGALGDGYLRGYQAIAKEMIENPRKTRYNGKLQIV